MTHVGTIDATAERAVDADIHPLISGRWSPRSMSAEALSDDELERLLEAARWAPSSYNGQPWRYCYARRGEPAFADYLDCLVAFNQGWARHAGVLLALASDTISPKTGEHAPTHAFDTGSSWMALALQGQAMGLVVHAMEGFDRHALATVIRLPANHELHCVIAVGRPGRREDLDPAVQEQEQPSDRRPRSAFAFAHTFPATG